MKLALRRTVSLAVLTAARSVADHHEDLGCSIQGPPSRQVRRAHAPLRRALLQLGPEKAVAGASQLLSDLEDTPAYRGLCQGTRRRNGRRVLREDVLFPNATRTPPRYLHLRCGELGFDLPVHAGAWPRVIDFLTELASGMTRARLRALPRERPLDQLIPALLEADWLEPWTGTLEVPLPGARYVGHNTVSVASSEASIWVDPYFRPADAQDFPGYQPLQPRDLPSPDAVLITHSHGDHFHLGSLLQLPRDTLFLVPHTERESLFATDCQLRLSQLGFHRVERMAWGATRCIKDIEVEALPFYGEQPTSAKGLYPGLHNDGNAWTVRTPGFSAAFLADAGRDARGDMAKICRAVGKRAPVDVLFCGIRGFRLRPIFYGTTTLESFLVNVPLNQLVSPQQLMATPEDALRYGALLGAQYVVPCADGGAPWYWREGMGPRYPGYPGQPVPGASAREENADADPFPERLEEARRRQTKGSRALLLRPGDAFSWDPSERPRISRSPGFSWPFDGRDGHAPQASPGERGSLRPAR